FAPGSSPVPRWMARLMLSAGMFSFFAARIAVRSRGFMSGSPPDFAAIAISLMRRVKILPRLASSAPFLCLMVAHLEWPDMQEPQISNDVGCVPMNASPLLPTQSKCPLRVESEQSRQTKIIAPQLNRGSDRLPRPGLRARLASHPLQQ